MAKSIEPRFRVLFRTDDRELAPLLQPYSQDPDELAPRVHVGDIGYMGHAAAEAAEAAGAVFLLGRPSGAPPVQPPVPKRNIRKLARPRRLITPIESTDRTPHEPATWERDSARNARRKGMSAWERHQDELRCAMEDEKALRRMTPKEKIRQANLKTALAARQ